MPTELSITGRDIDHFVNLAVKPFWSIRPKDLPYLEISVGKVGIRVHSADDLGQEYIKFYPILIHDVKKPVSDEEVVLPAVDKAPSEHPEVFDDRNPYEQVEKLCDNIELDYHRFWDKTLGIKPNDFYRDLMAGLLPLLRRAFVIHPARFREGTLQILGADFVSELNEARRGTIYAFAVDSDNLRATFSLLGSSMGSVDMTIPFPPADNPDFDLAFAIQSAVESRLGYRIVPSPIYPCLIYQTIAAILTAFTSAEKSVSGVGSGPLTLPSLNSRQD